MLRDIRIYIGLLALCSAAIYAGSFVPQLTTAGGANNGVANRAAFEAAFGQEHAYCEENADDLDCQCFANVAGVIIASEQPRIPGAFSPDQTDLARSQASDSC